MRYIRKKCPNCNFLIEQTSNTSWSFGSPLKKCPNCGTISVDEKKKEITMLTSWDYLVYIFNFLLIASFISFILPLFVYYLLTQNFEFDNFMSIILSIILGIFIFIICICRALNVWKKEKQASLERLKDKKYIEMLKNSILSEDYDFDAINNIPVAKIDAADKNESLKFIILLAILIVVMVVIAFIYKMSN